MFKENKTNPETPEQIRANKYQIHLQEVKEALIEEIEVFKPLTLSVQEQAGGNEQTFEKANLAVKKLHDWMQDNPDLARIKTRDYKNIQVMVKSKGAKEVEAGLPEFTIPVLVFPDNIWVGDSHSPGVARVVFGQDYEKTGPLAFFCPPEDFEIKKDQKNPLGVTGLILTKESTKNSSFIHEAAHFLDFYRPFREGINKIISEIIAFRQEKFIFCDFIGELEWNEVLSCFIDEFAQICGVNDSVGRKKVKEKIINVINIIKRLDKILKDSAAVTHILLNCLTLEDIEQWGRVSDEDLLVLKKNYEKE